MDNAPSHLPVTIMRGGTSKGVFIRDDLLPAPGTERDALLLRLMGSPDPMQLDGLGGTWSSTSKVVAVVPSACPGIDVDYRFAQVGIETATVDETGNCGNLASAVGPYAVDSGFVAPVEPTTTAVLRNLNTGAVIRSSFPVVDGRAATAGDQMIAGVPTPGPRIVNEYIDPTGTIFGTVFPTGKRLDHVAVDGCQVTVSVVDVVHTVAFVKAGELGIDPSSGPPELNADAASVDRAERLRAACAALLPTHRASSNLPRLVLLRDGSTGSAAMLDVIGTSAGRFHHALPVTSILCTAAAAVLEGTLPFQMASSRPAIDGDGIGSVQIHHPKGEVEATVRLGDSGDVTAVGIVRTARRLMDGTAYLRLATHREAYDDASPDLEESDV